MTCLWLSTRSPLVDRCNVQLTTDYGYIIWPFLRRELGWSERHIAPMRTFNTVTQEIRSDNLLCMNDQGKTGVCVSLGPTWELNKIIGEDLVTHPVQEPATTLLRWWLGQAEPNTKRHMGLAYSPTQEKTATTPCSMSGETSVDERIIQRGGLRTLRINIRPHDDTASLLSDYLIGLEGNL
jgi:hypothetical protein